MCIRSRCHRITIMFAFLVTLSTLSVGCDFFYRKQKAIAHYDRISEIVNRVNQKVMRLYELHDALTQNSISLQDARYEIASLQQEFSVDKQAYLNESPPKDLRDEYALLGQWFDAVEISFTNFIYVIDTAGTQYEDKYYNYLIDALKKQEELNVQSYKAYQNKLSELGFYVDD